MEKRAVLFDEFECEPSALLRRAAYRGAEKEGRLRLDSYLPVAKGRGLVERDRDGMEP
jgi:hypothetical protein